MNHNQPVCFWDYQDYQDQCQQVHCQYGFLFYLERKKMIWVPRILFSNTKADLTSQMDELSFAKVVPNSQISKEGKNNFFKRMGKVYTPTAAITFAAMYWYVGLRNAEII